MKNLSIRITVKDGKSFDLFDFNGYKDFNDLSHQIFNADNAVFNEVAINTSEIAYIEDISDDE
ncbi:hypothetical protein [Bacillus cereus]|uniref:hypothetical protein n=1 Tax=Bacillus cereus group TaxID=86661 RepID=UPI001BA5D172|nr:hypothetical protein [Bacillus cereus]MBR9655755.1 hypothetical protein [Bacillus cereus]